MVYVATNSITSASRATVMQIQNELTKAQYESSAQIVQDPGLTLGARSSQLVDLTQQQALMTTITNNNAVASTRLGSTITVLNTLRTSAQSFLSALTAAATSGGTSPTLQNNARTSLAGLTTALNSSVSGEFIFAGINSAVTPVTDYTQSPASANKSEVDTTFLTAFGTSQTSAGAAAISGTSMQSFLDTNFASIFSASGFGTTWSSASSTPISSLISQSQSVDTSVSANAAPFRQLAQAYTIVTEFGGSPISPDAQQAAIKTAMSLVSGAMTGLTAIQANIGITQNAISTANDNMKAQGDLLTTQTDSLVGVDSYDLITRIGNLQTQLQASYTLTSKLQSMSLVNYLS